MLQRKRLLKICRHRIKNLIEISEKASYLKEESIVGEVDLLMSKQKDNQEKLRLKQIEMLSDLIICPICEESMDQITSTHLINHNMNLETFKNKHNIELFSDFSKRLISINQYLRHKINPRTGWHHSEETRGKISQSNIGKNTWTKGKHHSEETKLKMSGENNGFKKIWNNKTDHEKKEWSDKAKIYGARSLGKISKEGIERRNKKLAEYWSKEENRKKASIRTTGENNPMFGVSVNHRSYRGTYNSKKGGQIHYKSNDERIFAIILDNDSSVLSFSYEPIKIPYYVNRRQKCVKRNTYPDFFVSFDDGTHSICEVKGEFQFIKDTTQAKLDAMEKYCEVNDISFQLITIRELFDLSQGIDTLTKEDFRILNRRNNRFLRYAN
ncbi:MAG: NUMOD3 domain-containing DNA-binding protein [archaeon]|nr:NUMOD3 domain-containing DNA-binding protein [archaeon]